MALSGRCFDIVSPFLASFPLVFTTESNTSSPSSFTTAIDPFLPLYFYLGLSTKRYVTPRGRMRGTKRIAGDRTS